MWRFRDKNGNEKQAAATAVNPQAKATTTATTALSTGALTAISFASAEYDSIGSMWAVGNPTRLVAPVAGLYDVKGYIAIGAAGSGSIDIGIKKNGATLLAEDYDGVATTGQRTTTISAQLLLAAGDYIELVAMASTARSLILSGSYSAALSLTKDDGAVDRPVAYPASLVGQEMAFIEATAAVAGITGTTEGAATTLLTAPAFTADGISAYEYEFYSSYAANLTATTANNFVFFDNGVVTGQHVMGADAAGRVGVVHVRRRFVPVAGVHTVAIKAFVGAGNLTVDAGAGGAGAKAPMFLRVRKVT